MLQPHRGHRRPVPLTSRLPPPPLFSLLLRPLPHMPPDASLPRYLPAPLLPPRALRHVWLTLPQSRPTQSDIRESSPGYHCAPGIQYFRHFAAVPRPRSCTFERPAQRQRDQQQTFLPSVPAVSDTRALLLLRRYITRLPLLWARAASPCPKCRFSDRECSSRLDVHLAPYRVAPAICR